MVKEGWIFVDNVYIWGEDMVLGDIFIDTIQPFSSTRSHHFQLQRSFFRGIEIFFCPSRYVRGGANKNNRPPPKKKNCFFTYSCFASTFSYNFLFFLGWNALPKKILLIEMVQLYRWTLWAKRKKFRTPLGTRK